jgi:hypothetical protein
MDKYSFEDLNSVWMKQVKRNHISPDEEIEIQIISNILISEFSDVIHNVTNKIIRNEFKKRPKANLHQKLLIKRQVINNVSENIINITINMAKQKFDIIKTEPEVPVVEQIEMSCDNFDHEMFRSNYSYLDEEQSMQVDYSHNTYQEENVDIM